MQIAKHKVVTLNCTLTDDEGKVIDSSKDGEPLVYIQGIGNLIPGLEAALEGKSSGDRLAASIPPTEAYGERDEALMQVVARNMFNDGNDLEVGVRFRAQLEGGAHVFTVVGIDGDQVTIDGNHPLAGMRLNFDVAVVGVREATAEELSHGHAHGPEGHGH